MEIYTAGFTRHSAQQFFESLRSVGIQLLIDVRLNNTSQLAGFAKRDDLQYLLREIVGAQYRHDLMLAPTQDMLDTFKKGEGDWSKYEQEFTSLLNERRVAERLDQATFDAPAVLLCSESTAEHCHRRLILEYLDREWGNVNGIHL